MLVKPGESIRMKLVSIIRKRPQALTIQKPSQQRKYPLGLGTLLTIAAGNLRIDHITKTHSQKKDAPVSRVWGPVEAA